MFILIWSGLGLLPVGLGFLALVVGDIAVDATKGAQLGAHAMFLASMAPGLCIVVAGAFTWSIGRALNRAPGRLLVDKKTGQEILLRRRHSLYWVPMQWWSFPLAALGIILMCVPQT